MQAVVGHDIIFTHATQVTTENGFVHCYDARTAPSNPSNSKPVWLLQAHDEGVSSFDVNPIVPGFIVTGSMDKTVKLWNVLDNKPSMVVSRNLDVGKVFSAQFAPDQEVGFRCAVAGSKGSVRIWDTSTNAAVRRAFANRISPDREPAADEREERVLGLREESEEESEDDAEGVEKHPDAMEE